MKKRISNLPAKLITAEPLPEPAALVATHSYPPTSLRENLLITKTDPSGDLSTIAVKG